MHIAIIGNSAAGLSAARIVRKLMPWAAITIISDEPGPAYARCLIADIVSGIREVQGNYFVSPQFYHDHDINLMSGHKVSSINTKNKELTLEGSQVVKYDRLLVAAGATPLPPGWPGADLPGVFTLRTAGQAAMIGNMAGDCAAAVVEGGGLVSLKAAYALKKRGVRDVTVLVKSPHVLIKQLDSEAAGLVEKCLAGAGIKFYYGTGLAAAIKGTGNTLQAVELEGGRQLPAGLVVVGKGVRPNSELIRNAGGMTSKGIVVNEYLETSLPDIYAAGDCIQVTDFVTGRQVTPGLWTLAVEQGRVAGYNLAGRPRKYQPPLTRMNSGQFEAVPFVSVGDIRGWDQASMYRGPGLYRKLCFRDSRLTGYILVGRVNGAGLYTALIKRAKKIPDKLKNKLINGKVTGADIISI